MAYIKTAEDHLADINGTAQQEVPTREGLGPQTSAVQGGEAGSSPSTTTAPNTPNNNTNTPASPRIYQDTGAGYFNPLSQARTKIQGSLGQAKSTFEQAAGPSRTFVGIGGQGILDAGIDASGDIAKDRQEIEAAQGLFGASYAGPRNLSDESVSNIRKQLDPYLERGRALGSLRGVATIAQERAPGLTRGQALFEARALRQDPEFTTQAMAAQNQANALDQEFALAQQRATAFAGQRTKEEADIAAQAGDYLRGQRSGVSDQIQAEVARRNAERNEVLAAYDKILGADDDALGALMATKRESLDFDPNAFDTEARQIVQGGTKMRNEIMAKYDTIKDVPLLEMGVNSHGRPARRLPDEWYAEAQKKYSPEELATIKKLAGERQDALETEGFSQGTPIGEPGKFGELLPLYHGVGDLAIEDIRPYLDLDQGTVASRENVATGKQRNVVNNINEIMGEVDRIADADPYRAAQIMADTDTYLAREEAAVAAQKGAVTESATDYANQVRKARKRYKKMMKIEKYAKVARIVNNIAVNALLPGVGSALYEGERSQGSSGTGDGGKESTAGKTEQNEGKLAYALFG